jgi:hypothetical protein
MSVLGYLIYLYTIKRAYSSTSSTYAPLKERTRVPHLFTVYTIKRVYSSTSSTYAPLKERTQVPHLLIHNLKSVLRYLIYLYIIKRAFLGTTSTYTATDKYACPKKSTRESTLRRLWRRLGGSWSIVFTGRMFPDDGGA